jgi:hypothetical protein
MSLLNSPTVFFDRKVRLQMGTVIVEKLKIVFNVKKSLSIQANHCDIKVYNLNEASRTAINEKSTMVLYAGYFVAPLIFQGKIDRVYHLEEGPNIITHIKGVDGLLTITDTGKPTSITGTTVVEIIRKLIPLTTTGAGNFEEFVKGKDPKKITKYASTKSPYDSICQLADALNANVTIQHDNFLFLEKGKSISHDLTILTPRTGLVGSPDIGKKGSTKARCFIQRDLNPGYMVRIISRSFPNPGTDFRIESVEFKGDTHGEDFTAHLDLTAANQKTGDVPTGD